MTATEGDWEHGAVTRELIVMRHAKAEQFAVSDHDRELTERGERDAAAVGAWVAAQGLVPDHVFVSSAARTRGTWEALRDAAGLTLEPEIDRAIYAAGTDAALEILRAAPATAERVLIIGHNPTMAYLVHLLDDGGAEAELFARVSTEFPTAAVAVLQIEGAWSDLDVGGARITRVHVGRG